MQQRCNAGPDLWQFGHICSLNQRLRPVHTQSERSFDIALRARGGFVYSPASASLRPRCSYASPDSKSAPECVSVVVPPPLEAYLAVRCCASRLLGFEGSFGPSQSITTLRVSPLSSGTVPRTMQSPKMSSVTVWPVFSWLPAASLRGRPRAVGVQEHRHLCPLTLWGAFTGDLCGDFTGAHRSMDCEQKWITCNPGREI